MLYIYDDAAARFYTVAVSDDIGVILQCHMNDLAFMAVHRFQDDFRPVATSLSR